MANKWVLALGAAVAVASAFGALTEATELYQLTIKGAGSGVTAVTEKQSELPDLPTPAFWFDCTRREGWEYTTVNGTNFVTKIPSLVGDRFLTTDVTLEGTTWKGWDGSGKTSWGNMLSPYLMEFDDLPGGPALDFGPLGSRRAMIFNPHQYEGEDVPSNNLKGIGTVITLYGSQEGGGYFLGGGSDGGYQWNRVFDSQTTYGNTTQAGLPKYWCPLMRTANRQKGLYIHNDFRLTPGSGAMSGSWEAIAFETDVASFDATGLGVGDSRNSFQTRSAGMRIAEMMIFDSILTEAQLRRANVYLQQKWLNRAQRGWNGNANVGIVRLYPQNSVSVELNAPAGETLSVGTLRGGFHGEPTDVNRRFVKTGAGALKVGDASNYTGPIEVREGTLALARKSVPTVDELPMGVYVRFDASDPACLVTEADEDGREYVKTLKNLAGGRRNGGQIFARPRLDVRPDNPTTADLRPWVRDVGLASGRPLIDFGWRGADGRYLVFGTNEVMTASHEYEELSSIHTAVALVRVEAHGGNLMDGYFARSYIWVSGNDGNYESQILTDQGTGYDGEVYLNGRKIGTGNGKAAGGFLHRGYHVIAYRVRPTAVSSIGSTQYRAGLTSGDGSTGARGGVQLGELLLWNRPLTEAEILDASAYLAKKWLGAEMPGYKNGADEDIPDVQVVNAAADGAKIDVPAGETVNVRKFVTKAPAVKTGAGTLEIGPESDTKLLSVAGGSVKVVKSAPTVTETAAVAPGAAIHLDASDLNTMRTSESDGRTFVELWYSKTGYEYAIQNTLGQRPWINSDPDALLNGKSVLDFGGYSIYSSGRVAADARYLYFSTDLDSVRSVFLVLGSQQGGGNPLGERYYEGGNWCDYLRYGSMEAGLNRGMFAGAAGPVKNGEVYTNGVLAAYNTCPTGGYQLWELHPVAGTHISALAVYKGAYMFGGCRIAEVIIYERPLSEREKVATRNYLAAKWFPDVMAQQDLPDEPTIDTSLTLASVGASVDSAMAVEDPISADAAVGSATLTKTGAETLSVRDLSAFTGTLDVREGTLALTGEPLEYEPALVTEGRILHLDATDGVLTLTNADSTVSVTNWVSKLNDGWAAMPVKNYSTTMSYPTLLSYELNALPVVKLENNGWNGTHHDLMVFCKDGIRQNLGGIKSVFWVIGSQEGGGFVLGGGLNADGTTHGYWFHRGGDAGEKASDTIINHNANANLKDTRAVWRLNGETIAPDSTGLSGGYDRLSFVQTDAETAPVNADGLAFDGRILNTPPEDYRSRIGRQRLAELIVYDRIVTDEERAQIEAYLAAKWGLQQKAVVNSATVSLAADATLKTSGNQYVGKLAGSGTVDGDVTAGTLVAAVGADPLTVTGTFTIAAGIQIELRGLANVTGDLKDTVITVLQAGEIDGIENRSSVVFTGDEVPEGYSARLRVVDGKVLVTFKPKGVMLIVR